MKHLALLTIIAIAMLAMSSAPTATACDGMCSGYGFGMGQLYRHMDSRVPYFAAHPPVYYSYPVARPYGYSPFAYPPGTRTPHVVAEPAQAQMLINPYVEQASGESDASKPAAPKSDDKVAKLGQPQPLMVLNPFVVPSMPVVQVSN